MSAGHRRRGSPSQHGAQAGDYNSMRHRGGRDSQRGASAGARPPGRLAVHETRKSPTSEAMIRPTTPSGPKCTPTPRKAQWSMAPAAALRPVAKATPDVAAQQLMPRVRAAALHRSGGPMWSAMRSTSEIVIPYQLVAGLPHQAAMAKVGPPAGPKPGPPGQRRSAGPCGGVGSRVSAQQPRALRCRKDSGLATWSAAENTATARAQARVAEHVAKVLQLVAAHRGRAGPRAGLAASSA